MVSIYRDEEIIQNDTIDKIKSELNISDLILSITINSHNIKSLTLGSLKYALTCMTKSSLRQLEKYIHCNFFVVLLLE